VHPRALGASEDPELTPILISTQISNLALTLTLLVTLTLTLNLILQPIPVCTVWTWSSRATKHKCIPEPWVRRSTLTLTPILILTQILTLTLGVTLI